MGIKLGKKCGQEKTGKSHAKNREKSENFTRKNIAKTCYFESIFIALEKSYENIGKRSKKH